MILLTISFDTFGFKLDDKKRETARNITTCIINNQYEKAITIINDDTILANDPLLPVLKLVAVGIRDVDYESIVDSATFLAFFKEAETSIADFVRLNGVTSYATMLSGLTKAIHATYYLRQKKYIGAMQNLFGAIDLMKKVQEADSLNYEVDLFLGLYEYAQSELRSKLWWILFWYPGNREQGIQRVIRCSEKALITGDAAKLALCEMFLQDKRNEEATRMINNLKLQFPSSRFVFWAEVKMLDAEKKYLAAADLYNKLSRSYRREPAGTYNFLVTRTREAQMSYKAGKIGATREICTALLHEKELQGYNSLKKEVTKLMERCDTSKH